MLQIPGVQRRNGELHVVLLATAVRASRVRDRLRTRRVWCVSSDRHSRTGHTGISRVEDQEGTLPR